MTRHNEIIEVTSPVGLKRYRIVEMAVDPPNTIKRTLVPVETTEDDLPVNARLLDERETEGHLARSSKPDSILVGDMVRIKINAGEPVTEESSIKGTVESILRTGMLKVRWENGKVDRYKNEQLAKVW